jgi:hypothetical protein
MYEKDREESGSIFFFSVSDLQGHCSVLWEDNNGSVSFDAPVDGFVSVGSTLVTVFRGVSDESFSSLDKCSVVGSNAWDEP